MDPKWWVLGVTGLGALFAGHRWWVLHNRKHSSIDEMFVEIRADVKEIKNDLKQLFWREPPIAVGGSPLRLNDLGETVSVCVSAKDLAEQLGPKVRGRLPSGNPYDVQDFCKRFFETEYEPAQEHPHHADALAHILVHSCREAVDTPGNRRRHDT